MFFRGFLIMRKIVVYMNAGMVGTDAYEFYEVRDTVTDEELDHFAWQRGVEHAESYGIYYSPYYEDEDMDEEELDSDSYSNNIEGWWEPYDSEKHDKYSMTGTPNWEHY